MNERWSAVIDILGVDLAAKLVERFGGESIYVPKEHRLLTEAKHRAVVDGYKGGNVVEYARSVGMSYRQVYEIFKRYGVVLPEHKPKP